MRGTVCSKHFQKRNGKPTNLDINRRRTRRTQRKNATTLLCHVFYSNINGFKGKSISFQQIIQQCDANVVVLCETKLANVNKIKEALPGYDLLDRCVKVGKGEIFVVSVDLQLLTKEDGSELL